MLSGHWFPPHVCAPPYLDSRGTMFFCFITLTSYKTTDLILYRYRSHSVYFHVFLAHLSQRFIGELIIYPVYPASVVVVVVVKLS